jgi:glycine/D-amino acid oxidase-like deaminating enzyme
MKGAMGKPLRRRAPLWLDRPGPPAVPRYSALRSDLEADIVVVGGGITGAAVAWTLSGQGVRVALVEARRVGRGSTAASTALLMQEPDEDFGNLRRRYGRNAAARIWRRSRRANERLIGLLTRLRIACDFARRDSVYYTLDSCAALRRELTLRQRAGVGGRWLDDEALERIANLRGGAAIRTAGNAQADPYKICVGVLDAAERQGAAIFENTRAGRIATSSDGIVLHTPHGRIRAERVVIATGYATPEFKPLLSRFRMTHTYVLATERLSPSMRRRVGLSQVMLWDTDRPYHYARWTSDGRLLLGGGDRPLVPERERARAFRDGIDNVRAHFQRLYPSLAEVSIDYSWEGLFAATPDGLPYVGPHRRYPRHLFALGYGGNGMTFGFLAAELICERLMGRETDEHNLFSFGRARKLTR